MANVPDSPPMMARPRGRLLPGWKARIGWPGARPVVDLMTEGKPVVVFGDVHLRPDRLAKSAAFHAFVDSINPDNCAALICLGDLFEFYFGEAQLSGPDGESLKRLAAVRRRGVPVALIPGNRDFMAGRDIERLGVPVWRNWLRLRLNGDPRLLAFCHGDNLMQHDQFYLAFRRVMHMAFVRSAAAKMPAWLLLALARWMRWDSRLRHRVRARRRARDAARGVVPTSPVRTDRRVPQEVAEGIAGMADAPRVMVVGHFHQPASEPWHDTQLVTVGDWSDDGGLVALIDDRGARLCPSANWTD